MRIAVKQTLAVFLVLAFEAGVCSAQWHQTGPCGGSINCFAVQGTNAFGGTADGGVFQSTNNG